MSIWDLAGFIVFLPVVLIPLVMTILLQMMPFEESIFAGLFTAIILALCLRVMQTKYAGKIHP
ncbi:MAG: hypothetical protein LBE76_01245 [Nitrososphaerota archaeon]|jgi:hypothetical protein|nr:hypothetical protein [Nitrososphaerota archaeon]